MKRSSRERLRKSRPFAASIGFRLAKALWARSRARCNSVSWELPMANWPTHSTGAGWCAAVPAYRRVELNRCKQYSHQRDGAPDHGTGLRRHAHGLPEHFIIGITAQPALVLQDAPPVPNQRQQPGHFEPEEE